MTFNQAPYIVETMNGFCMQQTSSPFVCAIVDDASTDGEQEVIEKYLQEHFILHDSAVTRRDETDDYRLVFAQHKTNKNCYFVVLLLKYNHHLKKDKYPYFAEWTDASKYIALCEGDDYWTDPLKLQKQVDFMETHPDYIMCCHDVEWHGDQEFQKLSVSSESDIDLKVEDIISRGGYYINICSVVYRKELELTKTNYQKIAQVGDHPLCIKAALSGKVRFMHDTMGVYRCFVKNGWTDRNYHNHQKMAVHLINTIEWMQALNKETKRKYNSSIVQLIGSAYSYSYKYGGFPNRWAYLKASYEAGGKVTIRACKDILIEFFPYLWSCYHAIQIKGKKRMRE